MADEIIDLTRYFKREPERDLPRGAMALWGADGERSRFALPLWRIIYLAGAERGLIVWQSTDTDDVTPLVALDLAHEPARTDVDMKLPRFSEDAQPVLIDRKSEGLVVYLGARAGRSWSLIVDGRQSDAPELEAQTREDILFLAGECAGLLFFRDLAGDGEGAISDGLDDDEG